MPQMQQSKVGSRKKGKRSSHLKPYYTNYRVRLAGKLIRARGKRDKQIAFFKEHPELGSPSQLIMRVRVAKRKLKKKLNEQ